MALTLYNVLIPEHRVRWTRTPEHSHREWTVKEFKMLARAENPAKAAEVGATQAHLRSHVPPFRHLVDQSVKHARVWPYLDPRYAPGRK